MTEQATNPIPSNGTPSNGTAETALAQIRDLPGMEKRVVQVPEDDALVGKEAAAELAATYQEVGEEYMRHRLTIAELTRKLSDKQTVYSNTVQMLSKKHVKEQGQYDYLPDVGAFVGFGPKPQGDKK